MLVQYMIFLFCVFIVRSPIENMLCKKIAPLSKPTSTLTITSTYVPNPWNHQKLSSFLCMPGPVFSYKLRYIVGFWLVEMAISTDQKPTIYRNLYENTGPECYFCVLADWLYNQPISHSLIFASLLSLLLPFQLDIRTRKCIRQCETDLSDVTTWSTRLRVQAWCGDLCWDEHISPSQRCRRHIISLCMKVVEGVCVKQQGHRGGGGGGWQVIILLFSSTKLSKK